MPPKYSLIYEYSGTLYPFYIHKYNIYSAHAKITVNNFLKEDDIHENINTQYWKLSLHDLGGDPVTSIRDMESLIIFTWYYFS